MDNYFFAEKESHTLIIKCTDNWREEAINYLIDNGFKITSSSEWHWDRQIDEIGRTAPCWEYDEDFEEQYFIQEWQKLNSGSKQ